jgi:hypothetical protein
MSRIRNEATRADTIAVLGAVETLAAQCADLRQTIIETWDMLRVPAGSVQQMAATKPDVLSETEWHEVARTAESELRMTILDAGLCRPADLGHPPAEANHQESPVVEDLWGLALDCMAHELKDPTDRKRRKRDRPQASGE